MIWGGGFKGKERGRGRGGRMASLTLLFLEIIMPTPKPELWAETNFPLAPWKNLTLWCRSPSGSTKEFVLLKDGTGWIATRPASEQVRAAFPLGALTQTHTGSYHCHSWEEMAVSEPSEALELVGTGKKRPRVRSAQSLVPLGLQHCFEAWGNAQISRAQGTSAACRRGGALRWGEGVCRRALGRWASWEHRGC